MPQIVFDYEKSNFDNHQQPAAQYRAWRIRRLGAGIQVCAN
ncbi:hypothetical protein [Rhodoferax ferrireducens]|nr:hypothetical protein [Rhodoferax ferrireducens]